MAYIDFKKLKARISLPQILDHYELLQTLEETSRGYQGACPFCGSNAFKANTEKNAWFCFGECKTKAEDTGGHNGGNVLDFVAIKEGVSVKKAAEQIAGWFPEPADETTRSKKTRKKETPPRAQSKEPAATPPEKAQAPTSAIQEGTDDGTQTEEEPNGRLAGEGSARLQPNPMEDTPSPDITRDLTGLRNPPLDFTLKTIDVEHPVLEGLGLARETLRTFGLGYFTGKGIMREKVAIPFHNDDGLLVAYVGYAPKDGSLSYPQKFDRRLELYNAFRAENAGLFQDGIVLVTDLLNVLRLYELGVYRAVALPTGTLHEPQLETIRRIVGSGGQVDFVPWTLEYSDNLRVLSERFHVRLHRYYQGSEDEFLSQVASSFGW